MSENFTKLIKGFIRGSALNSSREATGATLREGLQGLKERNFPPGTLYPVKYFPKPKSKIKTLSHQQTHTKYRVFFRLEKDDPRWILANKAPGESSHARGST